MPETLVPSLSSVISPDALTERVLPDYALTAPFSCRLVSQSLNDTYRVLTGDGAFFLRVYRHGWRTDGQTAAEIALLNDLYRSGLRVSRAVPRSDGEPFGRVRAAEGVRQVALFTPAEGSDVRDITSRHAEAYGGLAAKFHATVDDSSPAYDRMQLDECHLIDEPLEAIRSWAGDVDGCCEDLEYLETVAMRVRDQLMALSRDFPGYGLCHGDLHPGNVLFDASLQPTLFDFDCCGYGWRAYDLSVFLWNSYLERRSAYWRAQRWKAFVRGYRAIRSIDDDELANVPYFLVARQIWLMGLDCRGQSGWLPQWLSPEWFSSMVGYVRRWVDEYPALS